MLPHAGLSHALTQARAETDKLFAIVHSDALYERPIPERNRIIFYLGHLEAFDWNLVAPPLELSAFHASFDRLFSFGIDPGPDNLPADQPADWPREDEVRAYNARVRAALHLAENERIAGFVYIGTPAEAPQERDRPALADIVSHWKP